MMRNNEISIKFKEPYTFLEQIILHHQPLIIGHLSCIQQCFCAMTRCLISPMAGVPLPVNWEDGSLPNVYLPLPGAALWLAIVNSGVSCCWVHWIKSGDRNKGLRENDAPAF